MVPAEGFEPTHCGVHYDYLLKQICFTDKYRYPGLFFWWHVRESNPITLVGTDLQSVAPLQLRRRAISFCDSEFPFVK